MKYWRDITGLYSTSEAINALFSISEVEQLRLKLSKREHKHSIEHPLALHLPSDVHSPARNPVDCSPGPFKDAPLGPCSPRPEVSRLKRQLQRRLILQFQDERLVTQAAAGGGGVAALSNMLKGYADAAGQHYFTPPLQPDKHLFASFLSEHEVCFLIGF